MAPIVREELGRCTFSPLLLDQHSLPAGERAIYPKLGDTTHFWPAFTIDRSLNPVKAEPLAHGEGEFVVPILRAESGSYKRVEHEIMDCGAQWLLDIAREVARDIRDKLDERTLRLLEEAARKGGKNVVNKRACKCLTEDVLRCGISHMRSVGVFAEYIVMTNDHLHCVESSRAVDFKISIEEQRRGVVATFDRIKVLLTRTEDETRVLNDRVLLIPDEEVGTLTDQEGPVVELRHGTENGEEILAVSAYCRTGHALRRACNLVLLTDVEGCPRQ